AQRSTRLPEICSLAHSYLVLDVTRRADYIVSCPIVNERTNNVKRQASNVKCDLAFSDYAPPPLCWLTANR
ncbi:MAG: hypothetical protein V3T90_13475, partial [Anaerolineae bacterium]